MNESRRTLFGFRETAGGDASWISAERGYLILWLAMGLGVAFHPAIRRGWTESLAGYPDNELTAFLLEHAWRALVEGRTPLAAPPYFHPFAAAGGLTESFLGGVPFYGPFRLLGATPLAASLFAMVVASIATYLIAFALLRRSLAATAAEAGFAAFLLAFGSAKIARIYHPQLFFQVPLWLALALVATWLRASPRGPRRAWEWPLLGALLAWQLASSVYVTLLVALLAIVALALLPFFPAQRLELRAVLLARPFAVGAALIVAAALTAWILPPYVRALGAIERPDVSQLAQLAPSFEALLNPGDRSLLGSWLADWTGVVNEPYSWEHSLGLGLVTSALVLFGLRTALAISWLRWLLSASLVAWLLVVRWPGGHSIWFELAERWPALGVLRAVSRLHVLLLPVLAVAALLGAREVRQRFGRIALGLGLALATAEQIRDWGGRPPAPRIDERIIVAAVPPDCPSFFVSTRQGDPPGREVHLAAMWAALQVQRPTVNGYSGYVPIGWALRRAHATPAQEPELRDRLSRWLEVAGSATETCWIRLTDLAAGPEKLSLERLEASGTRPR
jgi:hypothetical protein